MPETVESLPEVLQEEGYTTGAFCAANPCFGKWKRGFDTFWNAGLDAQSAGENRSGGTVFGQVRDLLKFSTRNPVD